MVAGTEPEDAAAVRWYRSRRAWAEAAVILALVAVLVGLVVTACQGDDDPDPPTDTSTTLDAEAAAEEEVRQAYRDFLAMTFRVPTRPTRPIPTIAEHATGDVRANLERVAARDRERGIVIRGGPEDNQTILSVSVDGDTATLSVCYVDQSGVYDAATGAELVPMETVTTLDTVGDGPRGRCLEGAAPSSNERGGRNGPASTTAAPDRPDEDPPHRARFPRTPGRSRGAAAATSTTAPPTDSSAPSCRTTPDGAGQSGQVTAADGEVAVGARAEGSASGEPAGVGSGRRCVTTRVGRV